ncbi:MAG: hypothetical protein ACRDRK_11715 [Pseudonocardia sp.]
MSMTPPLTRRRARRAEESSTLVLIADLERFWPSRRGHAFDELCR